MNIRPSTIATCAFLIMTTLFATPAVVLASSTVAADDQRLQYRGRIDFSNPHSPAFTWPGTQVVFRVSGKKVAIILDDETGANYYQVMVNGNADDAMLIDCEPGEHEYPIDPALLGDVNEVVLHKRNESVVHRTRFNGLKLGADSKLLEAPAAPQRRMEFYGDSITVGTAVDAAENEDDNQPQHMNNFLSYGAITARNLDAEYRCISKAGIGLMKSWFNFTMPEFYQRSDSEAGDSKWDFSQWQPDVIVVNLLQNDSFLLPQLDSPPTGDTIVANYRAFIEALRERNPNAQIVCALGSMSAVKESDPWRGYVETAVAQLKAGGDANLSVCFMPLHDGFWKHPRAKHHLQDSKVLTAHVRKIMAW